MLGTVLVEVLSRSHDVSGIDIEDADIRNRDEIAALIAGRAPELVVHAAANTDVDGCEGDERGAYLANGTGTANVGFGCRKAGAACLYISTDFVFDGEKETPYDELDMPRPINIYGRSKYMGEVLLSRTLPEHYIVRTEWLYGRKGRNFVDQIIAKAGELDHLQVVDDQFGSPTYALDLAEMIAAMADDPPPYGIYHLTNSGRCSWYEFARTILSLVGLGNVEVKPVTQEVIARPARRPRNSELRNLMYTLHGFPPARHWREALVDYIKSEHGSRLDLTALTGTDTERRLEG